MSEPFLAEIRAIGFNFAMQGWAYCDGQIMPINQNQSLYSLLGTTYGGDGRTSFALPDLRGRTPVHVGEGNDGIFYELGMKSGEETHTLSAAEMANHSHAVKGTSAAADARGIRSTRGFATSSEGSLAYASPSAASMTSLRSGTITNAGGGQAHNNMQPYTTIGFVIALRGLFPSRN